MIEMSEVTLNDILLNVNDFNQNYSTSTIDQGNKIRAINRGIEYIQRRLGLPSDKRIKQFYFYEDTLFYDADEGTNELLEIYYNTDNNNRTDTNSFPNRWFAYKDIEILRNTASTITQNRFAFTSINGNNQILMKGYNTRPNLLINAFNSTTGLTGSSSITNLATDSNIYQSGGSSVSFGMNSSESTSTITFSTSLDIRLPLNQGGKIRLYVDWPTGISTSVISSLTLTLQSSTGNYYTMSTTTQDDGTAWSSTGFNRVAFDLPSAVNTGSPDASAITTAVLSFVHGGSFVTQTNVRINNMYLVQPDLVNLIYYSAYKGTDSTGAVEKILLTDLTDKVSFGSYAPDLILPIALKAALILWPQLRGDINFLQVYKADCEDTMKLFSRSYPRYKNVTSGSTQLVR